MNPISAKLLVARASLALLLVVEFQRKRRPRETLIQNMVRSSPLALESKPLEAQAPSVP